MNGVEKPKRTEQVTERSRSALLCSLSGVGTRTSAPLSNPERSLSEVETGR
jgi:hypothetical protein